MGFAQADAAAAVAAGDDSLGGLRDAALISVMSDGLLRVSEVAALEVADIAFEDDGSGRATVRRSKTDQEGVGVVLYLGPPTVEKIKAWLEEAQIDEGPLFRRVYRGETGRVGTGALSTVSVRTVIKRRCADSGTRRVGLGPLAAHRRSAVAGSRGRLAGRNADRGALDVAGDARPLCPRAAGRPGRGRPHPLRPVIFHKYPKTSRATAHHHHKSPILSMEKTLMDQTDPTTNGINIEWREDFKDDNQLTGGAFVISMFIQKGKG